MNYKSVTLELLRSGKNLFITGGGGVGKTTLTRTIIAEYEADAKRVAKLASTGMAATLIGGQTLHSFLDLGIAKDREDLKARGKFEIKKAIKKRISAMDLIVIDEISMVSDTLFDMVALRLQQAEFGGVVLVVGDFLQLPPVVRSSEVLRYAFDAKSWQHMAFETIELTHIYRTDDRDFIELLHQIRFGIVDANVHEKLNSFIKPLPADLSGYTFLFGKNDSAAQHNKKELGAIDGDLYTKEVQIVKHTTKVTQQEIDRFMRDARIDALLELKIGAPILFSRNAWNYYNGERGVVVKIDESALYIQKQDGKVVKVERVAQHKTEWKERLIEGKKELVEEPVVSLYHYPVQLAFGITIHKSQGMSISDLIIDTKEIFAPSQFYVAISRASNPHGLILIAPQRQWYELIFTNRRALEYVKGGHCDQKS